MTTRPGFHYGGRKIAGANVPEMAREAAEVEA